MKNVLIVIAGPTAIGKTSAAISIAQQLNAEIISADSRQFYKELKIGTAAPTPEELAKVKHHFVGHLSVADYYNVSRFENDVLQFLKGYFENNRCAVMVGGSGLYIDAVCKGIDELPDPDEDLRNNLKKQINDGNLSSLIEQLKELDPEYYKKVDLKNPNRILRALEVCIMTGKPYSSLRNSKPKTRDFDIIKIGLNRPRAELVEIIHKRVDKMIETGLIEEVNSLTEFKHLNALNTVGYKEIFNYLDGKWSLDLAIEKIKTNTRRYAKRQMTWFGKDEEIEWFLPGETKRILKFIESLS